jgi:hypothetical protein
MDSLEADLDRVVKIAREGLRRDAEDDDDTRLDTFVVVAIYSTSNGGGKETESTAVWSEARRHHAKVGVLHQGLERLRDNYTAEP